MGQNSNFFLIITFKFYSFQFDINFEFIYSYKMFLKYNKSLDLILQLSKI
jgi:hypothetical protein